MFIGRKIKIRALTIAASFALILPLTACSASPEEISDASCLILDQCSTVPVENDAEACDALNGILAPMNNGSAPSLVKFEKAWPQIESLAFQVQNYELQDALNKTSINMNAFVQEMKETGEASTFIISELSTNFNDVLAACAAVY